MTEPTKASTDDATPAIALSPALMALAERAVRALEKIADNTGSIGSMASDDRDW